VETNKPIRDASIKVNDVPAGKTDSSGNLIIENVTAGQYLIHTTANKYFSNTMEGISIQDYENYCLEIGLKPIPVHQHGHPRIYFDEHSYLLTSETLSILDTGAIILSEYKNLNIKLEGNCDVYECRKNDTVLSYQRTTAVKDYLVALGIESYRISVRGWGCAHPIAPNNYPNGRKNIEGCQLNRYVEIRLVSSSNVGFYEER